ncbi:MAG: tetratricopeptide repeat protein [Candidatus Thiodiazotropha sp.]
MLQKLILKLLLILTLIILTACSGGANKVKAFTRLEMADRAYAQGRWVEAEQHYLSITEVASNDFYAWFRLGNARLHQGNLEAAIHAYESAIQRDPRQPKPHHNLGEAYMLLARQSLEKAYNLAEKQSYERSIVQDKLNKLHGIIYKPVRDLPSPAKGLIR